MEIFCYFYLILNKQYFIYSLCKVLGCFAFEIANIFFYIFSLVDSKFGVSVTFVHVVLMKELGSLIRRDVVT